MFLVSLFILFIIGFFIFSKIYDLPNKKLKMVILLIWLILLICFCVFYGGVFMFRG